MQIFTSPRQITMPVNHTQHPAVCTARWWLVVIQHIVESIGVRQDLLYCCWAVISSVFSLVWRISYTAFTAGDEIQLHSRREVGSCWADRNGEECSESTVSPGAIVDAWYLHLYLQGTTRLHALLLTSTTPQSRKATQRNHQRVSIYTYSVLLLHF